MSSADMTGTGASRSSHSAGYPEGHYDYAPRGWASAVSIIAGMLLGMVAAFEILQGVAAIAKDEMFVSGRDYVYQLDTATWGWTHVVLGILLTAVAMAARNRSCRSTTTFRLSKSHSSAVWMEPAANP